MPNKDDLACFGVSFLTLDFGSCPPLRHSAGKGVSGACPEQRPELASTT
jgi:hypothetical protein